jgi:hypothetical protein
MSDAAVQTALSGAPQPAFSTVTPVGPPPPASVLPLRPAAATAIEELRLATDFLTEARLQDAHLVISDKPLALAEFTAVWRSGDAAGAVKIVPLAPDVSAIGIASNLIAVDPRICKGDFTAARFRTNVANSGLKRNFVVHRRQSPAGYRIFDYAATSGRVCRVCRHPQRRARYSAGP